MTSKADLAMYCKDHFPQLPSMVGYSFIQMAEAIMASLAFAGIAGWFAGKRGVTGIKTDLNNVKNDVTSIKAKIEGTGPTVVAPATA